MKILIVDDEPLARSRLQSLLEALPDIRIVGGARNGRQALELVEQHQPDIVLLDIRMPGMDGMEAATHLNKLANPPAIIFTTAYDQYALAALKNHAVDYLLKPIKQQQLQRALQAATQLTRAQLQSLAQLQEEHADAPQNISARVQGGVRLIPVNEVLCFLAEDKYVTVSYRGGEVLIEESLKSLEHKFADQFIRVHRNALVARRYIKELRKDPQGRMRLYLQHGEKNLEVSRRHLPAIRQLIRTMAIAGG
ncbi:LytR/AlgR family response regulator transcription factor [Thiohalophilus thiocyanatoxydans]|uniref:LytTR family two component transcriptional regulator n=1 Tax=Thiohalophilus thiocyanatoxydans TaxID=381308 RepID=A0A4R8ISX9_9GAMM|nr:LytTR family DNA-binding domain-containing protein [Thiohalophilus thiocyanatoxydans]TDY03738.1 LytTR family two component transcriptional regulator [Thiohalophilus thiocyanatoxydans]